MAQNRAGRGSVAIISEYTGTRVRFLPLQRPGVALGGPDHRAARQFPPASRPPRAGWPGLSLFVDVDTSASHRPGQPPHQTGRIDGGAVRGEGAPQDIGGPHPGRRLGRREESEVALVHPPGPGRGHLVAGPSELDTGPASTTVPPRTKPQAMPSEATIRPTSSTVDSMARRMASPAPGPYVPSRRSPDAATRGAPSSFAPTPRSRRRPAR